MQRKLFASLAALTAIMILLSPASALAFSGDKILGDIMYGGAIGGLLGGAWYLLDQEDADEKIGAGIGVGIIAGFVVSVSDAAGVATYKDGTMVVGMPDITVRPGASGPVVGAGLLNVSF